MFGSRSKKEASAPTPTNRRKHVSVPYPEPSTHREVLHNRRYVRENLGEFSSKSWWITATLPLAFTLAGSFAAIHNLSSHSNPIGAVGAWAGAEGVVAVFSYLSMLSMFRGVKIPTSYILGVVLATIAAVTVNIVVTPNIGSALALIAALAPIATAASVSAVFKVIKSCLDDAARVEFFELKQLEAVDLHRLNQLARDRDKTPAQDEAFEIMLKHAGTDRIQEELTGTKAETAFQAFGSLSSMSAPALEAPAAVEEDDEDEAPVPLHVVEETRVPVMRPEQRRALPEEGLGRNKGMVTVSLDEVAVETHYERALTSTQRAKRELAGVYWAAKLADRNLSDADFRRGWVVTFSKTVSEEALRELDRNGTWAKKGEIPSPALSKIKGEFPVEDFLAENPALAALISA